MGRMKTCLYCGKEYERRIKEKPSAYKKRKYCGIPCRMAALIDGNRGKKAHNNRQQDRICKNCGKVQMVAPAYADRPFCSRKCMGEWYSKHRRGEAAGHWQGGPVIRECLICGKEFSFDKGDLERREISRLYCSMSCKARDYSKGERNPNWRGGITPENRRARNLLENREWRQAVYERDDYTCQICGAIDNLHAHHIKSFSDYPKLRFELTNGLTVCDECHYEVHYGNV